MRCRRLSPRILLMGTDAPTRPGSPAPNLGVATMRNLRNIRLTLLAIFASFALAACSSPTAYDDCEADASECEFGHPGTGS